MVSSEKNTVRVVVGQPNGPHSGAYRLWTNANGGDIYISAYDLMTRRIGKLSLHGTGRWYARFDVPGSPPIREAWDRPPPFAADWVHALDIVMPSDELRLGDEQVRPGRWQWLPPARPGHGVVVSVLISTVGHDYQPATLPHPTGSWAGVIFRQPLSGADVAWVVVGEPPMQPWVGEIAAEWKARAPAPPGSRGFVFGEVGDGARFLLDLGRP